MNYSKFSRTEAELELERCVNQLDGLAKSKVNTKKRRYLESEIKRLRGRLAK